MSPPYDDDDDRHDYDRDDDDYEDERPSRRGRRSRSGQRPGKSLAIAIMTLIGGIVACLEALFAFFYVMIWGVSTLGIGFLCCLWPGPYYCATAGILAIIKGSQLLGQGHRAIPPPKGTGILLIVCAVDVAQIFAFNIIGAGAALAVCIVGILIVVFSGDPEVEQWHQRPDWA